MGRKRKEAHWFDSIDNGTFSGEWCCSNCGKIIETISDDKVITRINREMDGFSLTVSQSEITDIYSMCPKCHAHMVYYNEE